MPADQGFAHLLIVHDSTAHRIDLHMRPTWYSSSVSVAPICLLCQSLMGRLWQDQSLIHHDSVE